MLQDFNIKVELLFKGYFEIEILTLMAGFRGLAPHIYCYMAVKLLMAHPYGASSSTNVQSVTYTIWSP